MAFHIGMSGIRPGNSANGRRWKVLLALSAGLSPAARTRGDADRPLKQNVLLHAKNSLSAVFRRSH
jgi:hypothetical protein